MIKRLLQFWVVLILISGLITCWFAGQLGMKGYRYIRLNERVPVEILKWDVKMVSTNHYAFHSKYRYVVDGREFVSETVFFSPRYPNQFAATLDLKSWQSKEFEGWYQKDNPSFSSLEKKFPKKELINFGVALGVFLYFYCVKSLLSNRRTSFLEL